MTRPWSAYLRKATDRIPPMPVNLRAQLVRLLVPDLADLRQQLDQARRLAGEAQGRFREAERTIDTWRGRCHEFEMQLGPMRCDLDRAKADLDERHGPLLGPIAMERDQLKAELSQAVLVAEDNKTLLAQFGKLTTERDQLLERARHFEEDTANMTRARIELRNELVDTRAERDADAPTFNRETP